MKVELCYATNKEGERVLQLWDEEGKICDFGEIVDKQKLEKVVSGYADRKVLYNVAMKLNDTNDKLEDVEVELTLITQRILALVLESKDRIPMAVKQCLQDIVAKIENIDTTKEEVDYARLLG